VRGNSVSRSFHHVRSSESKSEDGDPFPSGREEEFTLSPHFARPPKLRAKEGRPLCRSRFPITPSLQNSITPFSQISRSFHPSGVQSLVLSLLLVLDRFFRHPLLAPGRFSFSLD
jgi:hypothetical protein